MVHNRSVLDVGEISKHRLCSPGSPDVGPWGSSRQLTQKLRRFIGEGTAGVILQQTRSPEVSRLSVTYGQLFPSSGLSFLRVLISQQLVPRAGCEIILLFSSAPGPQRQQKWLLWPSLGEGALEVPGPCWGRFSAWVMWTGTCCQAAHKRRKH